MSSYKRWASFPLFCVCSLPASNQELLPAFLMSDRKRVACVIYARDFSPGLHRLHHVFLRTHCIRTDAEPIVSYLGYIGIPSPRIVVSFTRHSGRKKTYDSERGTVGRQETRMMFQDSSILFRYCEIRISRVMRFGIINVSRC